MTQATFASTLDPDDVEHALAVLGIVRRYDDPCFRSVAFALFAHAGEWLARVHRSRRTAHEWTLIADTVMTAVAVRIAMSA